jgi:hypothetical protein
VFERGRFRSGTTEPPRKDGECYVRYLRGGSLSRLDRSVGAAIW